MACSKPTASDVTNALSNGIDVSFSMATPTVFSGSTDTWRIVAFDKFGVIRGGSEDFDVLYYYANEFIEIDISFGGYFQNGEEVALYVYKGAITSIIKFANTFQSQTLEISSAMPEVVDYYSAHNITNQNESGDSFGSVYTCPYECVDCQDCDTTPLNYSDVSPPFDKAMDIAGDPSEVMGIDITNPELASYLFGVGTLNSGLTIYNGWYSYGNMFGFQEGMNQFMFAVDVNGIIRMASMPKYNYFSSMLNGALLYLFGVETTGISAGDDIWIYYVRGSQLFQWVNFDTDNRSFPFPNSGERIQPNNADLGNVVDCLPDIRNTIWGWMDNIDEDLSQVPALQGQVSDYETQVAGYSEQDAWFDQTAVTINDGIFSMMESLGDDYVDPADVDPADVGVD